MGIEVATNNKECTNIHVPEHSNYSHCCCGDSPTSEKNRILREKGQRDGELVRTSEREGQSAFMRHALQGLVLRWRPLVEDPHQQGAVVP